MTIALEGAVGWLGWWGGGVLFGWFWWGVMGFLGDFVQVWEWWLGRSLKVHYDFGSFAHVYPPTVYPTAKRFSTASDFTNVLP